MNVDSDCKKKIWRKRDKPEIFLSLDLEMNQPSSRIIQIGAVAGNIITGEIFSEKFSRLVKCGEPLCKRDNPIKNECDITKLTGITEESIEVEGVSLIKAFKELVDYRDKWEASPIVLTWGGNDIQILRDQIRSDYPDEYLALFKKASFGYQVIDVKMLHQAWATANGISIRAGLAKAMSKHKLLFDGRAHNAMWDAYNTFRIAAILFSKFQETKQENI